MGFAVASTLMLTPAAALAEPTLNERILDIRERSRFVPEDALAELQKLQPELATAPANTRAEFLTQMSAVRLRLGQNDAALQAADQVIAFGQSLHDNVIIAKGMLARAYVLFARADVDAAHRLAFEAEKLAQTTGDQALKVQATITAGQAYAEQGDFPAALSTLQRAVDMARPPEGDRLSLAAALNALAKLHTQMKDYDSAADTLAELLEETEKLHSPGRMAMAKNIEYGLAIDAGQPQRALRVLQESLALGRQMGAERMVGVTLANLADSYLKQRDYPRAARYAQEALLSVQKTGDQSTEATARANLGQAYVGMGRLAEGKQQYELGMARYEQENNKPDLQVVLREYGETLERAGDLAGALAAYHRERDIANALFEQRRQQITLELQEKYEAEKKRRQIEMLRHENQVKGTEIDNRRLQQHVWWLLALVFALAAAVVGLFYRKVRNTNAQLKVKNLELKAQSTLDPLTSLYNRRHFQEFMRSLTLQQRQDGMVGALFLLDADHFKQINDRHGHAAGDAVLKMIAANLRIALRETDMIVRWGGEEFVAFLPAVQRHGVDDIARRILHCIASQSLKYGEHEITVNVSVGYAPFPLAPDNVPLPWERTVNLVDMALYLAKAHGRNRAYGVRGFHNLHLTSMEAIEQDLESAWRSGFVDLSVVLGGEAETPPSTP
ncbi:tetratricopeptide repeat-containing diguanylate cyclase [Duganella lactea]|nr:diguanylate cyclase [Duganella lactea]